MIIPFKTSAAIRFTLIRKEMMLTVMMLLSVCGSNAQDSILNQTFETLYSVDHKGRTVQLFKDYLEDVELVGMGEATHGTHEFFESRTQMFKYLVRHHGFSLFFLEADYANCLRVNRYIQGEDDEIYEVVKHLDLWPWVTKEMVDLIEWMKVYNKAHSVKKIQFIGVDVQQFEMTISELDRLLKKYNLWIPKYNFKIGEKNIEHWKKALEKRKVLDISRWEINDRVIYQNLIRYGMQIIAVEKAPGNFYLRDLKMGENVEHHLKKGNGKKGFFWGHNMHVNCFSWKKLTSKKWRGSAGGYLRDTMGKKYLAIGQDFDEGSFNAYYPKRELSSAVSKKDYLLGAVVVGRSEEHSLASLFNDFDLPILIDLSAFKKPRNFKMNNIGAAYHPQKAELKGSVERFLYFNRKRFDVILLIKESTPTYLLK